MLKSLASTLHGHDFRGLELEFRVGIQTSSGFHANIPKVVWAAAKEKMGTAEEVITIDRYVSSRQGESSRHVQSGTCAYFEHKKKIANDVTLTQGRFAIRSSLALESKEDRNPPNSFVLQRKKRRTSFMNGPWRIDFTRVETIPNKDDNEETYELEVELADLGYLFEQELHLVIEEGIMLAQKIAS
jgi:hypothetical protein